MVGETTDPEVSLSLSLSPAGRVYPARDDAFGFRLPRKAAERIEAAFARGPGHGLLHLGAEAATSELGPTIGYWRDVARLYFTKLSTTLDLDADLAAGLRVPLERSEAETFLSAAPPMLGIEYLAEDVLRKAWDEIGAAFVEEVRESGRSAEEYLQARNPVWKSVGRVFFHFAENKAREDRPFAFLATYTSRISSQGRVQHVPLGRAVEGHAAAANRKVLLAILAPVKRAAERSAFLREIVDAGKIYHPQAWTPSEAHRFLRDVPVYEESGIFVRLPDWWNPKSPPRLRVSVTVGKAKASALGAGALLDFSVGLSLEGEPLSGAEWKQILAGTGSLAFVKGRWVEVDREKLGELLGHWKAIEKEVGKSGVSFLEGMRLLAGLGGPGARGAAEGDEAEAAASDWVQVGSGEWLREVLEELRNPTADESLLPGEDLRTTLRPYQAEGVKWLRLLHRLRLGGCLADDMGLGKTVQVIALLLLVHRRDRGSAPSQRPSLVVVPASLIANWKSELARFAPGLRVRIAHPSEDGWRLAESPEAFAGADVVVTTYGMVSREAWLKEAEWEIVVLDEAQAIKNPSSQQTRAAKSLRSRHRLALTGTPVENRLSDLWSIFDFLNPGLLGNAKEFTRWTKRVEGDQRVLYGRVRSLVRPYLLRRLKTDRRIVADLPDKEEVKVYCGLRRTQAVLYQKSVEELAETLASAEGIRRRGIILAFLMRFKQICNHPSHWTGDGVWDPAESGKLARLLELAEEIASRQEKILVFTQFREMTPVLASALEPVFRRPGLILDGSTPVRRRREIVDAFQREDGPPFFVLSLKAGGTGLNLTSATHVVHFDRWWNPAVENQATDRAHRIGQKRNILVHKFVCRGTVEEKIDELIESKQDMADEILKDGAEAVLTEMDTEELMRFVSLDTKKAVCEC
ncbi:MAG: DEAD/DEAH box helicase [Planctomycetota bacterium]